MTMLEIIEKKKFGQVLSKEEIAFFAKSVFSALGSTAEYPATAKAIAETTNAFLRNMIDVVLSFMEIIANMRDAVKRRKAIYREKKSRGGKPRPLFSDGESRFT